MRFTTILIEAVLVAVTVLSFPAIVDADLFPSSFANVERRSSHSLPSTKTGETKSRSSSTSVSDSSTIFADNDQLVTEELLTIETCKTTSVRSRYYQDNRFSSPDPIFSSAANPTLDATGNRWLYANVPLQPIFGINDLPIEGLVQGFCESTKTDMSGYCHFTYELFDLQDGAIVVFASFTAEGATNPQGPSTLRILGGTGILADYVGSITLWPVSIDESILPAKITRDDSLFLGNRNGYETKIELQKPTDLFKVYSGSVASPGTVISVVPDGSGNPLDIGTEFLYNGVLLDAQNINSRLVPLQVDTQETLGPPQVDNQETLNVCATIGGYCVRIGPPDQNSVQGYCMFDYIFPSCEVVDGTVIGNGEELGSFTAAGIIVNSEVPGQLTVTGGTGFMAGATGLVEILPAAIDQGTSPPLLIQPPIDSDPFIGVDAWAHFFKLTAPAPSADPSLSVKSPKKGKAKKSSKKGKNR